ncbi:MAG: tetratricopeptide repeat protein [Planctomycetales bacterium]|nr:tetratricopeptide repeat protein [Planctomycetales bacterium]
MPHPSREPRRLAVPLLLIVLSLVIYLQTTGFGFVAFDDQEYVSQNLNVQNGINDRDGTWAITTTHMGNWHPLVWWSFQLDSQFYGNGPFGFHLTNVIVHTLSSVLLYFALRKLGLSDPLSAIVAVLFCVHPLNVESVAWVSERKGILSTFFWIAGMYLYGGYVRNPSPIRMLGVGAAMACGLMSKPSLLTFPFALMLLDFWPLCRIRFSEVPIQETREMRPHDPLFVAGEIDRSRSKPVLQITTEKIPLFLLSAAFCVIAYRAQASANAVATFESVPLSDRLIQIPCAYIVYIWHTFVPIDLAVACVPPHKGIPIGYAILATVILVAISAFVIVRRERMPYVFFGWFWFVGTMVPTSGIVPIGVQWQADRYTYIPNIGIFILVGCFSLSAFRALSINKSMVRLSGAAITVVLCMLSFAQARHWRDSETLFDHILQVNPDNHLAHSNLAASLIVQRDYSQAFVHAKKAIEVGPTTSWTRTNLALCNAKLGRIDEARREFEGIIASDPTFAQAHLNLGNLLRGVDSARAEACFREAVRLDPDYAEAHNNLGGLLASRNPQEAREHFEISLRIWPDNPDVHSNLGNSYAREGDYDRAIKYYRSALELNPDHPVARQNMDVVTKLRSGQSSQ